MLTRRLIALSVAVLSFAASARSENCSFLGVDPLTLVDRQMYVQVDGGLWTPLSQPIQSLLGRPVSLAYVLREQFRQGHRGVVVLKSGRNRQFDEPQRSVREKKVALVREAGDYCKGQSAYQGAVSAKAYDDYHDLGRGSVEISAISGFHAGYIGRRKYCKATDEPSADSLTDLRSNRGQFSFDPKVVWGGTYTQVGTWLGVTTALASSENLEDQRVEIKQYETSAALPTCVRIALPTQKRASFLRISDLEGLTFNQSAYVRSSEQEWLLTPQ